jgi:hypothetical protein
MEWGQSKAFNTDLALEKLLLPLASRVYN